MMTNESRPSSLGSTSGLVYTRIVWVIHLGASRTWLLLFPPVYYKLNDETGADVYQ